MITNKVVQEGDHVFGVYESPTTYIMIHYINKGVQDDTNVAGAHLDVKTMFNAMETLDRRKLARKQ